MADLLFFQDLFTDNTKMPKNRLPAQPLWRTITVKRSKCFISLNLIILYRTNDLDFDSWILDNSHFLIFLKVSFFFMFLLRTCYNV